MSRPIDEANVRIMSGRVIDAWRCNGDLRPEHQLRLLGEAIHNLDMAMGHSMFAKLSRDGGEVTDGK